MPRPNALALAFLAALSACTVHAQITKPAVSKPNPLSDFSRSIRALTEKVSPAVVQILVSGYGTAEDNDSGEVSVLTRQRSSGSGVVIDPDGFIITNAHVVRGAINVRVLIAARRHAETGAPLEAKIIGIDRGTGIAPLKVDGASLATLPFGDSDMLSQGDIVLAVGSPLGLQNSVSMGVVSSPARQINEDSPLAYIQTGASINPGNSGGALVDVDGQIVGINSFIYSQSGGSQGIGFAVPSNIVQTVYQQLRKKGHVHRGEVGVVVQDISPVLSTALKLPRHSGAIVADVQPDGPADRAGLKPRDILLTLDGRPIEFAREFEIVFYSRQKGDSIALRVMREGKPLPDPITIQVAEQEDDDDALADSVKPEKNLISRLGILCIAIDSRVAQMIPALRRQDG